MNSIHSYLYLIHVLWLGQDGLTCGRAAFAPPRGSCTRSSPPPPPGSPASGSMGPRSSRPTYMHGQQAYPRIADTTGLRLWLHDAISMRYIGRCSSRRQRLHLPRGGLLPCLLGRCGLLLRLLLWPLGQSPLQHGHVGLVPRHLVELDQHGGRSASSAPRRVQAGEGGGGCRPARRRLADAVVIIRGERVEDDGVPVRGDETCKSAPLTSQQADTWMS